MPKTDTMKVTIKIGGGYIFVQPGDGPDMDGYIPGYAMVAIVGGVRLTHTREFRGEPAEARKNRSALERIVPVGLINVHVQCPMSYKEHGEEYKYVGGSEYVAKKWPVQKNQKDQGALRKYNQVRSVNKELRQYAQSHPEYKYIPPPILFSGFSVFAFFNHGLFSTTGQKAVGSNMTTKEVIVRPMVRVDFDLPAGEEEEDTLIVSVATPKIDTHEIVMVSEEWLAIRGEGVIRSVEIGIEPLNPYAKLPVIGYEGTQKPPPDCLTTGTCGA
jgi:hypothetical protein